MSLLHYDPAVAHTMSSWLIEELEKGIGRPGQPEAYILIEVAFPGGTMRFAKQGTGSAGSGSYDGRLLSAGDLSRAANVTVSGIPDQEIEFEVSDVGERSTNRRLIAQEVAKHKSAIRNATVQVWLATTACGRTGWSLRFNGRLSGLPREVRPMVWRIRARPNDTILKHGSIPRRKVTTSAWPNAHADALDQWHPIVLGKHVSTGLGDGGALPTLYLDTVGFRYGVSIGAMKTITTVYEDGSATGAAYSVTSVIDGEGTVWTVIDFTTDRGSAVITVDGEGLTPNGDGSGSAITLPLDELRHVVTQYGYNDYHSGNYYAESSVPIDPGSWTRTSAYLAAKAHEGAQYLGGSSGSRGLLQLLSDHADQYSLRFFWKNAGTLAVIPAMDPYITSRELYEDAQWFRADELALNPPALDYDEQGIAREIIVSYAPSVVEGKSFRDLTVTDMTVSDRVTDELDFNWSAARL